MVSEGLSTSIQAASLEKMNSVFSQFNIAYEQMISHYSHGGHLGFMSNFLGNGIVPSLSTIDKLRAGKTEGSARVGHALSTFHYAIRNTGKIWGSYLDLKELDPEFQGILEYIKNPENTPCPRVLMPLTESQILEDILKRFSPEVMPKIPLKYPEIIQGRKIWKEVLVDNKNIHIERNVSDGDFGRYEYDVPVAALIWSIRQAGMEVLSRPKESTIRKLIERCVGIGDDAGKAMINLYKFSPEIFADYDRKTIKDVISDQRYWIRTARACAVIQGGSGEEFGNVLKLIGKEPEHITFGSASKFAVIIYALAERLEKEPENLAATRHTAMQPSIAVENFHAMVEKIKSLTSEIYEISTPTEKLIQQAKGAARQEFIGLTKAGMPSEDAAFAAKNSYWQAKLKILEEQRTKVEPVLSAPGNTEAVTALFALAQQNRKIFSDSALHYIEHARDYCQKRFTEEAKARVTAGRQM